MHHHHHHGNIEEIQSTRQKLHDALQSHISAVFGPGVVRDFVGYAEVVGDDAEPELLIFMSEHSGPWFLRGASQIGQYIVSDMTSDD